MARFLSAMLTEMTVPGFCGRTASMSVPGWHPDTGSVLVVLPAAERPSPAGLERLAHEYGLRDELMPPGRRGRWNFASERGRTVLVLEDPGGEPLDRLAGAPMEMRPLPATSPSASPRPLGKVASARPRPQGHQAGQYPGELHRRSRCGSPGSASPRACRASGRRPSRPRSSPARSPTWRPNRPDE